MSQQWPIAAAHRPQVRVATTSGSITIIAETRDDIEVASGGRVEHRASALQDAISVRRSAGVELRCPAGSDVMAGTTSGSVRLLGNFGDVRVTSHSGSISTGEVASADLRTASGGVDVQGCDGVCRIITKSGSVRVQRSGMVDVSGVSGKVRVSGRTAHVRSVSGTVEVAVGGDASVQTVSGAITMVIPPNVRPRIDLRATKRAKIGVDQGDDSLLWVRSLSGLVTVRSS